jgi:hypothetical protein
VTTTSVDAVATLTVRFTDWLGAWLETYLVLVEEDSDLRGRLSNEAGRTNNAGEILEGVHRRVGEFIESQRGVAGAYAAERIAEKSMLGFLDREVPKLPLQSRLELFPALRSQSMTVVKVGATAFGAIEQARTDVRTELRRRIPVGDLGDLFGELLDERFAGFEAAQEVKLEARVAPVEEQLAAKLDTSDFTTLRTRVLNIESRFQP